MHDQLSSVSIRQVIVPSTGLKLSQIHKTGEKCKLTDLFDSFPLFKPAIFLCFFEGLRMKCNLCATFKDKTGYLRNIIFLKKKSKAICFVLSFYTSRLSLEERALSKRAMCFAFKMKERPGLAVLLMRQALLQRAVPFYMLFFLIKSLSFPLLLLWPHTLISPPL